MNYDIGYVIFSKVDDHTTRILRKILNTPKVAEKNEIMYTKYEHNGKRYHVSTEKMCSEFDYKKSRDGYLKIMKYNYNFRAGMQYACANAYLSLVWIILKCSIPREYISDLMRSSLCGLFGNNAYIKSRQTITKDRLVLQRYIINHISIQMIENINVIGLEELLYQLAHSGNMEAIRDIFIMKKGHPYMPLTWAFYKSCMEGHEEVVKLILQRNKIQANPWDLGVGNGLASACAGGHVNIVKLILTDVDIQNYILPRGLDFGLGNACKKYCGTKQPKYLELMKLMIDHGANNCDYCHKKLKEHLFF